MMTGTNVFRFSLPLLLIVSLAACAAHPAQPELAPTSRDLDGDRILVTLQTRTPVGVTALSPSGRLDYQPQSAQQLRAGHMQAARELASAFDLHLEEDWPIPALEVHCFVFRLANGEKRKQLVARLQEHPHVESVQALQFFHGEGSAVHGDLLDDPLADSLADSLANPLADPLANWDEKLNERLLAAHRNTTGKSVTIAVIDAGVDTAHEDLDGASLRTVDFVDGRIDSTAETHGTAVVGLLAARAGNGIGIRGYAPDARILLIRACWEPKPDRETAICNSFTLAKALSLALESQADIVNLSISGPRDPLLERLAGELVRRGQLLIAAGTGNGTFPASVPQSILASRHAISPHSTGPALTLLPGNRYGLRNGTSITTARVAGAAALVMELRPDVSAAEFEQLLSPQSEKDLAPLLDVARLLD